MTPGLEQPGGCQGDGASGLCLRLISFFFCFKFIFFLSFHVAFNGSEVVSKRKTTTVEKILFSFFFKIYLLEKMFKK